MRNFLTNFFQLRDEQEAKRLGDLKQLAAQQKSILNILYNEKERPEFDKKVKSELGGPMVLYSDFSSVTRPRISLTVSLGMTV